MRAKIAVVVVAGILLGLPPMAAARPPGQAVRPGVTLAAGVFLVARRDLPSRYFGETVVLLVRHEPGGSLGLIVNRRTRFHLNDLLPELDGQRAARHSVFVGGPVAPNAISMLVRRAKPGGGYQSVGNGIQFSADRSTLEALLASNKPADELRLYAGHAGWAAGQLEAEVERGDWHLVKADADSVFSADDEDLWRRLINRLDPPGTWVRRSEAGPLASIGK